MKFLFEKWQGCKNHFVVLELNKNQGAVYLDAIVRQGSRICAKDGSGVGADGILVIGEGEKDRTLTIINEDGSIADNCGNGLRCASLYLWKKYQEKKLLSEDPLTHIVFKVKENTMVCTFEKHQKGSNLPQVSVLMTKPKRNNDLPWSAYAQEAVKKSCQELSMVPEEVHCSEFGNRHIVVLTDAATLENAKKLGELLLKRFPDLQANVHLARNTGESQQFSEGTLSEIYEAFPFERGVGLTQACGSGACAIACDVLSSGFTSRKEWIGIKMPGGLLAVKQTSEDTDVVLLGPGEFVFSGAIDV